MAIVAVFDVSTVLPNLNISPRQRSITAFCQRQHYHRWGMADGTLPGPLTYDRQRPYRLTPGQLQSLCPYPADTPQAADV